MAGVVGRRRDLIFVISELYYEVGGRHFVVGGKIAGCRHILTGLYVSRLISISTDFISVMVHGDCCYQGSH